MNESVNTVSSQNQLPVNNYIYRYPNENAKKRIAIIGNSITKHGYAPQIGWFGNWGMAATSEDKDFVHLLKAKFEERYGEIDLCFAQGACWEGAKSEDKAATLDEFFKPFVEFDPDILIVRIGENIQYHETDFETLKKDFKYFMDFLGANNPKRQVILTGLFWTHEEKEQVVTEIAKEMGYTFVFIQDLGNDPKMMATGLFEHAGVAAHPGDLGMQEIANRIYNAVK